MSILGSEVPQSVVKFFREKVGGRGWVNPPIRSSACGTAGTCLRKFLYDERLGIKPRSHESALVRGDYFHQFIAGLLGGESPDSVSAAVSKDLDSYKSSLIAAAGKDGLLPGGTDVARACADADQDFLVGRAMALASWSLYPLDPKKWEILLIEEPFEVPVEGLKQPLVGVFDAVIRKRGTSEVWIWDHKTTSVSPRLRASSASFSLQTAIYRIGLESMGFTDTDVVGCVHNIVRVPTIRYCDKDVNFDAYVERVRKWYVDEAAKKPGDPPIIQSWTRFTGDPLSPQVLHRLKEQDRISRCVPNVDKFPQNEKSCFSYNRPCSYLDLCTSDPVQWPQLVELKYDIRFRANPNDKEDS